MISTNGTFLFQDAIDRLPAYSNGVKLEIRTQSKSPLRLAYDVNNYVDFSVGSSGSLTINATGGVVVNGGIKIGNVSDCTADKAGTIRWSGQHFEGCTGTVWRQLDADSTPSIFSIVPAFGPVATIIDITGTNFVPGAQVSIGGVAATNVTYVSAMHITATIPANSTSGAKDVTVTNPDTDVAVKSGGFTYSVYATGGTITSKTISGIVYRIHTFTNTAGSDTLAVTTGGMLRIF